MTLFKQIKPLIVAIALAACASIAFAFLAPFLALIIGLPFGEREGQFTWVFSMVLFMFAIIISLMRPEE